MDRDWSSDVCSSDLNNHPFAIHLTNLNNVGIFNNGTIHFNITLPNQSLTDGNVVKVKLIQNYQSNNNITASFTNTSNAKFEVYSLATLEGALTAVKSGELKSFIADLFK
jgi:hypothetical protein